MLRKVVVVTASLGAITSAAAAPVAGPEPAPVTQPKAVAGYNPTPAPQPPTYWQSPPKPYYGDPPGRGSGRGLIAPQTCMGHQKHTHPRATIPNHHLTALDREVTDLGLVLDPQAGTSHIKPKTISPSYAQSRLTVLSHVPALGRGIASSHPTRAQGRLVGDQHRAMLPRCIRWNSRGIFIDLQLLFISTPASIVIDTIGGDEMLITVES
ncbi:hypothetical protein EYR41_004229 [Orbilia oligospora]|uniref:Uncharacterized protein n=1 Tax=Orbilia oligospora TaxID=2813651 RepID=A0A8H2E7V0_ORBOL|nr:hypothetical protein EYR41_004229 [Orbilia oligospora]